MKDFITSEMRVSAVKPSLLKRCKNYLFEHPPEYYEEKIQQERKLRQKQIALINHLGLHNNVNG
jgi:hypothetical protein